MPQLAIAPTFLNDFSRLDSGVQHTVLTAVQSYLAGDSGRLQTVSDASDPRVRVLQISSDWSGIVAPSQEGSYCLVGVRRHDEALSYARTYRAPHEPELELVEMPAQHEPVEAAAPVRGPMELADALTRPFSQWRLSLTPDHQGLVTAHFAGSAQVTGGPGTGQTVLALHRAAYLAEQDAVEHGPAAQPSVLLTTASRTLTQTLSAQLDRLVPAPGVRRRIEVATVDSLARGVLRENVGVPPEILSDEELAERWRTAARIDGLPFSGRFLVDEWQQVILAQDLTSLAEYVRCERSGRMLHLAPEFRPHVWEAIQRYTGAMRAAGEWSYPQVAHEAARVLRAQGPRYRHIVVTESQDLHPAHWRLLRAAVPEGPDDLFLLGDPAQRLVDTRVSLASVGINVRGRGHRLRTSYRVSQEILDWALPILGRSTGPAANGYVSVLHGPEPVVRGCASRAEEWTALREWIQAQLEADAQPSSIVVAGRNQWVVRTIAKELHASGIATAPLDSATEREAVRLGTLHGLKGQEFRYVALVGLSESLLPPKAAISAADGDPVAVEQVYQEERNLLFTACTRARDALYVSYVGAPSQLLPESVHIDR